jgi:uncharacterized OsmC-like protein
MTGPLITVRRGEGKTLFCQSGAHVVVTDRKPADGGSDAGCTSGELLLMAVGSCATGSVRTHLQSLGLPAQDLCVRVTLEPSPGGSEHDLIAIELSLPAGLSADQIEAARQAAICGGVVSRLLIISEVGVRVPAQGEEKQ